MNRLALILFFLVFSFFVNAQTKSKNKKANTYFEKAIIYYNNYDTTNAIKYCNKSIEKDNNFAEPYILKAQIFYENNMLDEAIKLLQDVLKTSPNYTQLYYILGFYSFCNNNYEKALTNFNIFLQKEKNENNKKEAENYIKTIKFRINAIQNPIAFEPHKLLTINTKAREYYPTLSVSGDKIIFTKQKMQNGRGQEDIYVSEIRNNQPSQAKSISSQINTPNNEGSSTFTLDGKTMFFTRCTPHNGCDLYVTQQDDNGNWQKPKKLPSPVNTRYGESQPSLSPDGKTLYFTSNRPGGKGKMDIWQTTYIGNGKWTKPRNLGDNINSEGNEMCPFIHFDDKTLYFSSDFFPGMGKHDLFVSRRLSDTNWSEPVNLGYPLNTNEDEYKIFIDPQGKTAYYSTEKDTSNKQDIYYFDFPTQKAPTKTIYFLAEIFDANTKKQIKAGDISIVELSKFDTIYSTKNKDNFITCLPTQKNYALNIIKKGYLFYSEHFMLHNLSDTINSYKSKIYIKPIEKNYTINLKNTFFETNSYKIASTSYVELNKLAEFLKENPTVEIEIAGHTDTQGSYEHNMDLSKKRAEAIKKFLITKKIKPERMTAIGYGYSKPIADNKTKSGRKLNRRTEIIILKK